MSESSGPSVAPFSFARVSASDPPIEFSPLTYRGQKTISSMENSQFRHSPPPLSNMPEYSTDSAQWPQPRSTNGGIELTAKHSTMPPDSQSSSLLPAHKSIDSSASPAPLSSPPPSINISNPKGFTSSIRNFFINYFEGLNRKEITVFLLLFLALLAYIIFVFYSSYQQYRSAQDNPNSSLSRRLIKEFPAFGIVFEQGECFIPPNNTAPVFNFSPSLGNEPPVTIKYELRDIPNHAGKVATFVPVAGETPIGMKATTRVAGGSTPFNEQFDFWFIVFLIQNGTNNPRCLNVPNPIRWALFDPIGDPQLSKLPPADAETISPNVGLSPYIEPYGTKEIDKDTYWRFTIRRLSQFTTFNISPYNAIGFQFNSALLQQDSTGFMIDFNEYHIHYTWVDVLTSWTSAVTISLSVMSFIFPKEILAKTRKHFFGTWAAQKVQAILK